MKPIHILFNAYADRSSVNAQNLNARDVAIRLDPSRFVVSMFCQKNPDPRLTGRSNIRLIQLPRRLGTLVILREMLRKYDAMFYMRFTRADRIYRWLRLRGIDGKAIIAPIESPVNILDRAEYASVSHIYDEIIKIAKLSVANSEYVAKTVKDRYATEIPVIYSGVDVNYFQELASQCSRGKQTLRVMFAGSFQERKHPELVLEASHQWPNVEFILMGDGPLRPLLINRITTEKLSNVSVISTKEYAEYAKLLVTADIFLFPSRIEGLGKVLLEAGASSIPALIFNDYHATAVLDGVTGYQATTFGEMLERLGWLIENEELRLRMGAAAAQHVKQFDWDLITRQWEHVFEEVVLNR